MEKIVERANRSTLGLGGSVWSGIQPNAPSGGVKMSGLGVEFSLEGLKEYTTVQTVYC